MNSEDLAVVSVNSFTNLLGMFFNTFLIAAITANRTKHVRIYAFVLLNFALTDLGGCVAALLTQIRLVPVGWGAVYLSSGFCGVFGSQGCLIGYSILIHFYAHCLWSLLISFVFRYCALFHDNWLSRKRVITSILFFYSFSLAQCIQLPFAGSDPAVLTKIFLQKYPRYNLTYHTISGHTNVLSMGVLPALLHMTVPVTPVYVVIILLRRKIIVGLQNVAISENARRMHSQLLQAITLQAFLPAIYTIPVFSFILGQTGIFESPILEYIILPVFSCIPVASPLITLYYVGPYRRWTKRLLQCEENGVQDVLSQEYTTGNRPHQEVTTTAKY